LSLSRDGAATFSGAVVIGNDNAYALTIGRYSAGIPITYIKASTSSTGGFRLTNHNGADVIIVNGSNAITLDAPTTTTGAATFSSSVTAGGLISTTVGDTNQAMRLTAASGFLQFTPYYDSTYGAFINSLNSAASAYVPITIQGSKILFLQGNVGIGTTDPQSILDGFSGSARGMAISNAYPVLAFKDTDGGSFFVGTQSNIAYVWNAGTDALAFGAGNTERMRITSGGNVLIGTTTDYGYKTVIASDNGLYVRGGSSTSHTPILVQSSSGTDYFKIRGGDAFTQAIGVYNNTSASANYVVVTSDGGLQRFVASSQKYKEEILDWNNNGLKTILALNPKTFKYKKDYYNKADVDFLGLIAEEVAEVCPYLADYTNEDRTGDVENVRYSTIVVPLIAAVKELKAEIEELKAMIAAK
jgi:hypothetical protein